jgi:hypothetical protein
VLLVPLLMGMAAAVDLGPAVAPAARADQPSEVKRLTALCRTDPTSIRWKQQARGGSVRATYDAQAAMMQCLYDLVDAPAAQKAKWLEAIKQYQELAELSQ